MKRSDIKSRIMGAVVGAAVGDAMGAPFEFCSVETVAETIGNHWIDRFHDFTGGVDAHGVWVSPAPAGTATDDTRYGWLFMELAIELGRMPDGAELARRLIDAYETPERYFAHDPDLAREQFVAWEGVCRGHLGESSALYPGVSAEVLCQRGVAGLNYPTLIGLITLTCAGGLFVADAEKAYRRVFAADFFDVGYAREATAVLAAAIGLAVGGSVPFDQVCTDVPALNPLMLGGRFGGPFIRDNLGKCLRERPKLTSRQELAQSLSHELKGYHVFDPCKTLAIAFASVRSSPDNPLTAIEVAVNHRAVDHHGELAGYQDIDCYACVTGALAGAVNGLECFPEGMVTQLVVSNREVYGIDLLDTAERFSELALAECVRL